MSVRSASVVVQTRNAAASLVRSWRECYCSGAIAELLEPIPTQRRITATIDSHPVHFEPSWFALGDVVLLFWRHGGALTIGFFDQVQKQFLPAIATLSTEERQRLGSRKSVWSPFVRELVNAALACTQQTAGALG